MAGLQEAKDLLRAKQAERNGANDPIDRKLVSLFTRLADDLNQKLNIKVEVPEVNIPEIKIPEIKTPDVTVNVPEIKMPKIPKPEVMVNVPEIKIPDIKAPQVSVTVPDVIVPDIKVPEPKVTVNVPETVLEIPEIQKVIHVDVNGNPIPSVSSGGASGRIPRKERVQGPKTDGFVTVGTASVQVLPVNTERHTFTVVNDSPNVIYIQYGAKAAAGKGIRLNAEGGSHTDDIYIGEVSAISDTNNSNLTVMEL